MIYRLKRQRPHRNSYDPALMQLMQAAFDEAWAMQSLEDDPFREDDRDVVARAVLEWTMASAALPT